jgi:nicotinate-nucleotide adenylyltransferase
MRVGVLGGTFNPLHLGHLVCAQEAFVQLGLDHVMLVPALIPPHKVVQDEPGAGHRLELARLAIAGDERMSVSDIEVRRTGPSYTVDTLAELHAESPEHDLYMIVGGDVAAGLPRWREPERVVSLATLAVARRRGTPRARVDDALRTVPGGERTEFFRMPQIAISSTLVRERVRRGIPVRYIVPEPVLQYIEQEGLYR